MNFRLQVFYNYTRGHIILLIHHMSSVSPCWANEK